MIKTLILIIITSIIYYSYSLYEIHADYIKKTIKIIYLNKNLSFTFIFKGIKVYFNYIFYGRKE